MDRFQLVEATKELHHAGTKATADIADIADSLGFQRVYIRMNTTVESKVAKIQRQAGYLKDFKNLYNTITDNSIVLLQHPFHHKQLTREKTLRDLKEKKHCKFICMVHDVEEVRKFRYSDYYKQEFETMMELADVIIAHNAVMVQFFIDRGMDPNKVVNLQIFDYLQKPSDKKISFEKSITVAGNLDTVKCGYVGELNQIKNVGIHLFGPNFNEEMRKYENIQYHGSFPVNEIPKKLVSGFGLVWDGSSIDGCVGESGQYLRFNNPHKLSLYLSSGVPVVIWAHAAEEKYVRQNRVGLCVESLRDLEIELNKLSKKDYDELLENVSVVQQKLINGYYGKKAIQEALKKL